MRARNDGTIVQVGSALAYRAIPLQSAYCGAKHAIQGFIDSIRCELLNEKTNVTITMVQMPALNTTQFGWVKSRLKHKAQPVPPIFQPEVGARAVYWAAHHNRRELYVGMSTVEAIVGNKVAPGILDHYLGRKGYSSQQTYEPESPDRPNNLWEPLPGDHGAHGAFDQRARNKSGELHASLNRVWLAAGFVLGAATALFAGSRNSGRSLGRRTVQRIFRKVAYTQRLLLKALFLLQPVAVRCDFFL